MKSFLELLKTWGPLGALLIAFIDGIGLPNPGGPDYLVLFLAWTHPETAWLSAALATVGALAGSLGLFWVARKGGEKYLERKASGPRAMKFRGWFQRYGLITVFIPALVPVIPLPMKFFVICAGALGVHPAAFLAVMAAGKIPRFFFFAWLGKSLGEHSTQWLKDHRWHFLAAAAALALLLYLLVKLADRRRSGTA
ncbi:MAG: VTT domain-containing protein [Bryobacteraceae bacterium]|nr:VTT domain-containing protein [Bryobacteraceae bacterium]